MAETVWVTAWEREGETHLAAFKTEALANELIAHEIRALFWNDAIEEAEMRSIEDFPSYPPPSDKECIDAYFNVMNYVGEYLDIEQLTVKEDVP